MSPKFDTDQTAFLRACLDEGIKENARLMRLAMWGAELIGERCDQCLNSAIDEWNYREGYDPDAAEYLTEADFIEASSTCVDARCVGGWIAYVPPGETIERDGEIWTEPKRGAA